MWSSEQQYVMKYRHCSEYGTHSLREILLLQVCHCTDSAVLLNLYNIKIIYSQVLE